MGNEFYTVDRRLFYFWWYTSNIIHTLARCQLIAIYYMDLYLKGVLSACMPKFFTDKETGKQIEYYQSGIRTKDGFVVLTSKDLRKWQGKDCVFRVVASPAKLAKSAFTLRATEVIEVNGEDVIE